MGTVFIILIIISFVISMIKHVNFTKKPIVHPSDGLHDNKLHLAAVVEKEEPTEPKQDENELVAVLTAAIAASLHTTTDSLQVRSFRRIGNRNLKWKNR
jgi:Na+-transporting methylmalonyl-CoA/oxaloacetate decarboxylase gamma subunit